MILYFANIKEWHNKESHIVNNYIFSLLQAFQQELESRQGMVEAMKAASGTDQGLGGQIEQLSNLWDRVNQLSELRENRLHGASKLVRSSNFITEFKEICYNIF